MFIDFQAINPIGTSDYASARSVYLHLTNLEAGRYFIMPTTYAPREQAEFMLRVYSKEDIDCKLVKKDMPKSSSILTANNTAFLVLIIACHKVVAVSRIRIIEATFTTPKGIIICLVFYKFLDAEIYCYIKTDDNKAKSSTIRASYTAKWDEMFIFYR